MKAILKPMLMLAALAGLTVPANAIAIGTCTIQIGAPGQLGVKPTLDVMSSTYADGRGGTATVTTNATPCLLNLVGCFSISVLKPLAFSSAPGGANLGTVFTGSFSVDGTPALLDLPQIVRNGPHDVRIDLTATKATGLFPAGEYRAQTTLLCE